MKNEIRLLMLSAMYENGGNTTHRFLDGHPQLYVYPFESQIGTRLVNDSLSSTFPVKYRWPVFPLDSSAKQDYELIIDEECKIRSRTPDVSKFRHIPFDFSDADRKKYFEQYINQTGRSSGHNVAAFFQSTFDAWKDYQKTEEQCVYVGYSPVFVIDADKMLEELPESHVLHVVRNPWSAYADTKKRPVPLSMRHYMLGWTLNQYYALYFAQKYPDRMHIVRTEDVMSDPYHSLGSICSKLGLEPAEVLKKTTWNGRELDEVYPWGTLRKVTPEQNRATADELSNEEKDLIREYTWQYLEVFDFKNFLG